MEVWRGLRGLGRAYKTAIGFDATYVTEGSEHQAFAASLLVDINVSWSRSVAAAGCPPYVAGAGENRSIPLNSCTRVEGLVKLYHKSLASGGLLSATRPASTFARVSEPWRAFAELYHSGWLSDADTRAIYQYQQNTDGLMRLGISGGANLPNAMFGHPAYGHAYGLVGASMAEEFVLFLYPQSHHGATKGTWTFWEKVPLDRR